MLTTIGSKERLIEMMNRVNKTKINENIFGSWNKSGNIADVAFSELINGNIKVDKTNTQEGDNESFVEITGSDDAGNIIDFRFKVTGSEGEQDGVYNIDSASIMQIDIKGRGFSYELPGGTNTIVDLNNNRAQEIFDVVSNYVNFESKEPEIDEEYVQAIKKIDSYPYGGEPRTMQTGASYADEKPVNSKIRVKSPELEKYVYEETALDVDNITDKYFEKSNSNDKADAIRTAKKLVDRELNELGLSQADLSSEKYSDLIKKSATQIFGQILSTMNEGESYPKQIGSKFKAKSHYPKKKKKPQTIVHISEDNCNDGTGETVDTTWKEMDGMSMGPDSINNKLNNPDQEMTNILLGFSQKDV